MLSGGKSFALEFSANHLLIMSPRQLFCSVGMNEHVFVFRGIPAILLGIFFVHSVVGGLNSLSDELHREKSSV